VGLFELAILLAKPWTPVQLAIHSIQSNSSQFRALLLKAIQVEGSTWIELNCVQRCVSQQEVATNP
jgi:hypothetical protein